MAGGKESPRQRMINMMYLVLTSLLALQVSNTVLQRFIFIDQSLEQAATNNTTKNGNTVQRMQAAVEESGNRAQDVSVLKKADEVRKKTKEVVSILDNYKEQFVQITGGIDEDNQYRGIKNEEKIAELMVRNQKGDGLKEELNGYTKFLADVTGSSFDPIAYDGKDHPTFKNDPNQNKKPFSELNFQNTPMVAALATLSQFKNEVLSRETKALDELARQVGAADVKFDRIVPMVKPKSEVVAAGTMYEADLFIAASSSAITPTMTVNGKEIPVEGGMGKVKIPASASSFDKEGMAEMSFDAAISIKQGGIDTTYKQKITYFVTKPVIQVQSASVSALFLNCGNELVVNVPQLGSSYNPSFNVKGGDAIKGSKAGEVTIIPTSTKVDMGVSSNGNFIGSESFPVKRIPKPEIRVYGPGGKEVNMLQGEDLSRLRAIEVKAVPDESFQQFLPKDARYKVIDADIILARGSRPIAKTDLRDQKANLNSFVSQGKPGDRIVIEVKKVQRMNFRNQVEDVNIGSAVFSINLK